MAARAVRERLAKDLSLWLADGLIPADTCSLLQQRYNAGAYGIGQAVKSLGIAGGLFAFFGLLGLVAAMSRSQLFAGLLLAGTGSALMAAGIRLDSDKLARHSTSSKALLLLAVTCVGLGIAVVCDGMNIKGDSLILLTGALSLAPVLVFAYRFNNPFLLLLGLLIFFHWVGSWSRMFGRSTYEFSIQDPRLTCVAALAVIGIGVCHEQALRHRTGRFFRAYEILGLLYLDISLLILSLEWNWRVGREPFWIYVLFAAAVAQIIAGARLHNPLFTGFGVTAFAVSVFTRYFEGYWRRLHMGTFFFLGGLGLFVAGAACEVLLRRMQQAAPPVQRA